MWGEGGGAEPENVGSSQNRGSRGAVFLGEFVKVFHADGGVHQGQVIQRVHGVELLNDSLAGRFRTSISI